MMTPEQRADAITFILGTIYEDDPDIASWFAWLFLTLEAYCDDYADRKNESLLRGVGCLDSGLV